MERRQLKPVVYIPAALVILIVILGLIGLGVAHTKNTITDGVFIRTADLSGLNAAECREKLKEFETQFLDNELILSSEEQEWRVTLEKLGFSLDTAAMHKEAETVGREGFFVTQLLERSKVARNGHELDLALKLDEATFQEHVGGLVENLITAPENARLRVGTNDQIEIIPHTDGRKVDWNVMQSDIRAVVVYDRLTEPLTIPFIAAEPERTTEDVENLGVTGLLARYSTSFDANNKNRSYNISVAAGALSDLLVAPGETVSFNNIVGPRSREAGYRTAPVIIDNELQDGIGGGVCQVSSTLYNASLLSNLKIEQRQNHSIPVSYVPLGRDATVVYGAIDFKFSNSTNAHLYLKTSVGDGRLTISIYGARENHPTVNVHSRVTETIEYETVYEEDDSLEKGEEVVKQDGANGYRVVAVREVNRNGTVNRENLPFSYYRPIKEIVAVGTKEPPEPLLVPNGPAADN